MNRQAAGIGCHGRADLRLVLGSGEAGEQVERHRLSSQTIEYAGHEGVIVTIDAMGCQRGIATVIVEKKADC